LWYVEIVPGFSILAAALFVSSCSAILSVDALQSKDAGDLVDRGTGQTDGGRTCECVPADYKVLDGGWSLVAQESGTGACPDFYVVAKTWVENPTANAASCSCACGISAGTCTPGTANFTLRFGSNNQCNDGSTRTANYQGAGCFDACCSVSPASYVRITGAAATPAGASCSPMPASSIPAPTSDAAVTCSFVGATGAGCPAPGDVCVPPPASPWRLCVAHADTGNLSCPVGFPSLHRLGTSILDSRACPSCMCNLVAACTMTATLWTNSSCTTGPIVVSADGTCQATGAVSISLRSASLTAATNTSCTPSYTSQPPQGNLDVSMPQIVCCR